MVTPLENRPWWADVISRLKSRKLRDLAREHGVSVAELQQALERTGHMPKPGGEASAPVASPPVEKPANVEKGETPAASVRLEAIRDQLGKIPDGVAATRAGVARKTVVEFRKRHNIPRYRGADGAEAEAPPPPPPVEAARPASRASKLDSWLHVIGTKPDREVAELAGMTTENVRMYRLRRGIAAGWRSEGARPEPAPPVAETRAPTRVDQVLAGFADVLGRVPDAEIAAKANISRSAVSAYRQRHGIPASRGRSEAAAPAPEPTPAPAPAPAAPEAVKAPAPAVAAGAPSVFRIEASKDGQERVFGLQASNVVEAARIAHARLATAGWAILSIRLVGEALV